MQMFKNLHRLLYLGLVFSFFCLCFPYLYLLAKNPIKHYAKIATIRRFISVTSLSLVGIRIKIDYEQDVKWNRPFVLCPNHTSILDITILTYLSEVPFSFIGKDDLLNNPVTRIFFKTIDIPINRGSKISAFKAYKKATELLQQNKSIVIFPEGKIDDGFPPTLHPFKSGAFKLATENSIPILPIVIRDAWKILWDDGKRFGSKPGVIHVSVLKPIEPNTLEKTDGSSVEHLVFNRMKDCWDRYNQDINS